MQLTRRGRQWSVVLAAAALIMVIAAAPTDHRSSGCLFCGSRRVEQWWLRLKWWESVQENQCSGWVRGIYPDHSNHLWATSAIERKGWGFGSKMIGCATGAGELLSLYTLRSHFGEAKARQLLARYHLELKGQDESFHRFLKTEFRPILTNAVPTTDAKGAHLSFE